VGTLVCFHAHPDDECIATAGVMAKAKEDGHRVVLVVATRGEHGEVDEGVLGTGESLADRRVVETRAAAGIIGVDRVEFLGYVDSGLPEGDPLPPRFLSHCLSG
jgi:LmbE family N-acetylglucosaminyl deacetylase